MIDFSKRPKLIALDLDGTLLTSDKKVSQRASQVIAALVADGVRVVLCTGTPFALSQTYCARAVPNGLACGL